MTPTAKLRTLQLETRSLLCIGLDIDPAKLPSVIHSFSNPVFEFSRRIIESTSDLVCAYKLNFAFFESLGDSGWETLRRVRNLIPKNILTIADAKRGDIGNSSERYAAAIFDDLKFNAVTVSPYMGIDSIEPFLEREHNLTFVLALTSNAGSLDFQRLNIQNKPLYEIVIEKFVEKNHRENIGFVVGATHPKELQAIRTLAPKAPLLIPGVGAQGGDLKSAIINGCAKNDGEKTLAVINASRSILYASKGENFAEAARAEAMRMLDEMRSCK